MVLKKWTKEEDTILLNMFSDTSNEELGILLGRSSESIRKRGQRLNLSKQYYGGKKCLTHDEFLSRITIDPTLEFITQYTKRNEKITLRCKNNHEFNIIPSTVLASKKYIQCKECLGKNNTYHFWGNDKYIENKLIEYLELGYTYKQIADILETTEASIQHLIYKLNLVNTVSITDKLDIKLNKLCTELGYTITSGKIHGAHEHFTFICNNGHSYSMLVKNFINKYYRCPICSGSHSSNAEKEILQFIKDNYTGWIVENDRSILNGKELDIILPDIGLAFEYNGIYWHSEVHVDRFYHCNKTNEVNAFGYQLFHIYEDTWLNKPDIVKNKILSLLHKSQVIYARQCTLREISYPKEFLDTYHLQGSGSPTKYNYGLFYKDELVAVMTFSKPRFNTEYEYELVRYCSKGTIVGGASKLLKYFGKTSIISYSNRSWSNGNLYKQLGFKYSHTSDPNYKYYKGLNSLSRYECQKHKLRDRFPDLYEDQLTEAEIMELAGYYKVYDSGNDVWVLDGKAV